MAYRGRVGLSILLKLPRRDGSLDEEFDPVSDGIVPRFPIDAQHDRMPPFTPRFLDFLPRRRRVFVLSIMIEKVGQVDPRFVVRRRRDDSFPP